MTFLDPSVQFREGRTCMKAECEGVMSLLVSLIQARIDAETATHADDPCDDVEPGSDDFTSDVPSGPPGVGSPREQIDLDHRIRDSCQQSRDFWHHSQPELSQLSFVAFHLLGLLTTSASVKRVFSVARAICTDSQLAQKQETIFSRVLIRANWDIAEPLIRDMLGTSGRFCSQVADDPGPEIPAWPLGVDGDDT
jgi:hypothetical protein